MKKTFTVVLAAMMLIAAFAGCGTKAAVTSTSPVVSEEPATTNPETSTEASAPVASETPVVAPSASPAA